MSNRPASTEPTENDQDKLPGRLQRDCVSKSRNAGPVNLIGWFGVDILNVPVSASDGSIILAVAFVLAYRCHVGLGRVLHKACRSAW